jgi:hypothetical protein
VDRRDKVVYRTRLPGVVGEIVKRRDSRRQQDGDERYRNHQFNERKAAVPVHYIILFAGVFLR